MSNILTIPREDSYYQTQGSVDTIKNLSTNSCCATLISSVNFCHEC